MNITVIARCDRTGLGVQSRNWVRLLDPSKVVLIDSTPFNSNQQNPEWYAGYNVLPIWGFIPDNKIDEILDDTDVLLTFEIPYNYNLFKRARERGVKTILQNNWEFTDYLQNASLPLPDLLVNHSYWNIDRQNSLWPNMSEYCPTPLFIDDFDDVYDINITKTMLMPRPPAKKDKIRFLHIAGRKTHEDRNGTADVLRAIEVIPTGLDFELVIKTQTVEIKDVDDPRIVIDRNPPDDEKDLYKGFDVLIMPRRYGGACLPMTEALASGLPVIMTDIDPNSKILPNHWLVRAAKKTSFMARTSIDVYETDPVELADKIAQFVAMSDNFLYGNKLIARDIAAKEYSSEAVSGKWSLLLDKLGVK